MQFWPGAVAAALGTRATSVERALRTPGAARPGPRAARLDAWPASRSTGSATSWSATSATSGCRAPSGSPGTSGPPTGSTRCSPSRRHRPGRGGRPPPVRRATRSPGRSGWTPRAYAAPARDALHRAARRAYALHALDAAATHVGRALGPGDDDDATRSSRLGSSCSAPRSRFYARRRRVPLRRRPDRLTDAGRPALPARRPRPARPGPGRCSARPPGCGPTAPSALRCLDRAVELFDELPDSPEKARRVRRAGPAAHAQLRARPGDRGGRMPPPRSPTGWAWSSRGPTRGSPRPPPATRPATGTGWTSCTRSSSSAAADQLLALRRAAAEPRLRRSGRRATGSAPTPCSSAAPARPPAGRP